MNAAIHDALELESVLCPICEDDDSAPVGLGEDFEYRTSRETFVAMRCEHCELLYVSPRPTEREFSRIYPPNYHAFDFSAKSYGLAYRVRSWLEARRLLGYCAALPAQATILDVGCGDGFHLDLLRGHGRPGWTLRGVDASDRAVAAARERGLSVELGAVESLPAADASVDLALMIATIEHVMQPQRAMQAVARMLKPGGRAIVVTDNTDTMDFAVNGGRYWGGYHFPRHLHLFNRRSLRSLAANSGLRVKRMRTIVSPVNWVYSIRNRLSDRGAPAWLYERFSLRSPVALAVFTVIDGLFNVVGRGSLLAVEFEKPRDLPVAGTAGVNDDRV